MRPLSSGESEFYAIKKGSVHSFHSQAILKRFVEDGRCTCLIGRERWYWELLLAAENLVLASGEKVMGPENESIDPGD